MSQGEWEIRRCGSSWSYTSLPLSYVSFTIGPVHYCLKQLELRDRASVPVSGEPVQAGETVKHSVKAQRSQTILIVILRIRDDVAFFCDVDDELEIERQPWATQSLPIDGHTGGSH